MNLSDAPSDDLVAPLSAGVTIQPALWLPQDSEWSLAAMVAVAEAMVAGGCRVRVYDADFAGKNPLARSLHGLALGGIWSVLGDAGVLKWWEIPLGAVSRGEHAMLWLGHRETPPGGWSHVATRARDRGLDTYWLPGVRADGLPQEPEKGGYGSPSPYPPLWLGLRFWSRPREIAPRVLEMWKHGVPPQAQLRRTGFWHQRSHAARAARRFTDDLETNLLPTP